MTCPINTKSMQRPDAPGDWYVHRCASCRIHWVSPNEKEKYDCNDADRKCRICVYLGDLAGETKINPADPGCRGVVGVYECDAHGQCTITKAVKDGSVACCHGCSDFEASE